MVGLPAGHWVKARGAAHTPTASRTVSPRPLPIPWWHRSPRASPCGSARPSWSKGPGMKPSGQGPGWLSPGEAGDTWAPTPASPQAVCPWGCCFTPPSPGPLRDGDSRDRAHGRGGRGCPGLGRRAGRGPGGLRRTPASRPARPDLVGDGPPGKKRLRRELGRDRLPPRICPERGPSSLQCRRWRTSSRDPSGLRSGLCHEIIWCPDLQALLRVPRFPHLKNEAQYIPHRSKCF